MLSCEQSLSEITAGNYTDMSVLERQRAMFRRLYDQHQLSNSSQLAASDQTQMLMINAINSAGKFDPCFAGGDSGLNFAAGAIGPEWFGLNCSDFEKMGHPDHPSFSAVSHGSSVSAAARPAATPQGCSSGNGDGNAKARQNTASARKRKTECSAEEECKDKGVEREAGESQLETTVKSERETSASGSISKGDSKVSEVQKPDYIHVRARRGQATDSHSLAERARREKISKKMKCLQELVPGCSKVIGKAGMLDEIINYVQSLQKQVEFLSMKLASVAPSLDFNIDNLFAKEFPACIAGFPTAVMPLEVANSAYFQYNTMQQQGASSCGVDIGMNPNQPMPQRKEPTSMSLPEVYLDSSHVQVQQLSTLEVDWQNLFNPGFN